MEFINGGSLEDFLKKKLKENKKLNEIQLLELTLSGLKGLKYLEKEKVIHRDIASRNFLVSIQNEKLELVLENKF